MATLLQKVTTERRLKHFLGCVSAVWADLKKFMALALESGDEPGSGVEIGVARAKLPLNIMHSESLM